VAQFVFVEMSRLSRPVVCVFGNCDGDHAALRRRAEEFGFTLSDAPYSLVAGGKRLVVTHEPLQEPPDCDFYLHGHTHRRKHEPGRPATVNPGEACGYLFGKAQVAILDTDSGQVEFRAI
jgi:putative phosphoesterase